MIRLLSIGKQLVNSSTCLLKQVLELAKLELFVFIWKSCHFQFFSAKILQTESKIIKLV